MTTRREALGLFGTMAGSALLGSLLPQRGAAAPAGKSATWPYVTLDPDAVAERAYKGFLDGHCMYGTFYGIVGELADKQGAPYNAFPFDMMRIGAGGMGDWATLCGALNGGALAAALLSSAPMPIVDELFNWYENEPQPVYRPTKVRLEITTKSVAHSPLCHASVSRWCEKANVKSFSPERDERCAWVTASCARKTVQLLNAQAAGAFQAAYPLPKEVQECRSCHDKGSQIEDTRGKMECGACHFELGTRHPIIERKKI